MIIDTILKEIINKLISNFEELLPAFPYFIIENYTFNNSTASLLKNEYFPIFVYLFVAILLSIIIVSASYLLVFQNPETEKLSPYECGFEPYEDARNKFDVNINFNRKINFNNLLSCIY